MKSKNRHKPVDREYARFLAAELQNKSLSQYRHEFVLGIGSVNLNHRRN